jgi:hypothetical protein
MVHENYLSALERHTAEVRRYLGQAKEEGSPRQSEGFTHALSAYCDVCRDLIDIQEGFLSGSMPRLSRQGYDEIKASANETIEELHQEILALKESRPQPKSSSVEGAAA